MRERLSRGVTTKGINIFSQHRDGRCVFVLFCMEIVIDLLCSLQVFDPEKSYGKYTIA